MRQVVKYPLVMLVIAMYLTSDTALLSMQVQSSRCQVQRSELHLSVNWYVFAANGPRDIGIRRSSVCLDKLREPIQHRVRRKPHAHRVAHFAVGVALYRAAKMITDA